jgi:hypothetical protein
VINVCSEGRRTLAGGFITGRGLIIKRARTPKIQPKISHITKGLPLRQYLADFQIQREEINLNSVINTCGEGRQTLAGGYFIGRGLIIARAHPKKYRSTSAPSLIIFV